MQDLWLVVCSATALLLTTSSAFQQPKDFCHYDGRALPDRLIKACGGRATQALCYFIDAANLIASLTTRPSFLSPRATMVDLNMIDPDTKKVLVCDGTIPVWIKESCYFIGGKTLSCGPRGTPLYNVRVTVSTELVQVGTLDIEKDLIRKIIGVSSDKSGRFSHATGDTFKTHTQSCFQDQAGDATVRITSKGVWGTLNNDSDRDAPVLVPDEIVGNLLRNALITTLRHVTTIAGRKTYSYTNCGVDPFGARTTQVCTHQDRFDCMAAIENGCGYRGSDPETVAPMPMCPEGCGSLQGCRSRVPAYFLPQWISAEIYKRDEPIYDYMTLEFEEKTTDSSCDLPEKLLMIMAFFVPMFEVSAAIGNVILLDCSVRGTRPAHPATHP